MKCVAPPKSQLEKEYAELETLQNVGKLHRVSAATVAKWFRAAGITPIRGWRKGRPKRHKATGAFAQWLKEHRGARLPRSPKRISEITGISVGAIKGFLVRRKRRMLKGLASLGDLTKLHGTLLDENGVGIPLQLIKEAEVLCDPLTYRVVIHSRLINGSKHTFRVTYKSLRELMASNHSACTESKSPPQ